MKIGVLPVSFFADLKSGTMTLSECADIVVESGAQGLDLVPRILKGTGSAEIQRVRSTIKAAGLEIGMLVAYPDFSHPDPIARKQELEQVISFIRTASELGAQFLRLTAGQAHPETGREEGINWVVEAFSAAQEAGHRYGVQLAFENHSKPFAWTYYDFAYSPDVFHEIVRRTAGIDLGILYDTANPVCRGDDPLDVLTPVVDRVRYVHASDTKTAAGGFQPVLLGTGAVPFDTLFACLKRNGYDGWISVEEISRMGHNGVCKAVAFVKNTWESIKGR